MVKKSLPITRPPSLSLSLLFSSSACCCLWCGQVSACRGPYITLGQHCMPHSTLTSSDVTLQPVATSHPRNPARATTEPQKMPLLPTQKGVNSRKPQSLITHKTFSFFHSSSHTHTHTGHGQQQPNSTTSTFLPSLQSMSGLPNECLQSSLPGNAQLPSLSTTHPISRTSWAVAFLPQDRRPKQEQIKRSGCQWGCVMKLSRYERFPCRFLSHGRTQDRSPA